MNINLTKNVVDTRNDHIKIIYRESDDVLIPVALVQASSDNRFYYQFLIEENERNKKMIDAVLKDLQFRIVERAKDILINDQAGMEINSMQLVMIQLIEYCFSPENLYSIVHWSYSPANYELVKGKIRFLLRQIDKDKWPQRVPLTEEILRLTSEMNAQAIYNQILREGTVEANIQNLFIQRSLNSIEKIKTSITGGAGTSMGDSIVINERNRPKVLALERTILYQICSFIGQEPKNIKEKHCLGWYGYYDVFEFSLNDADQKYELYFNSAKSIPFFNQESGPIQKTDGKADFEEILKKMQANLIAFKRFLNERDERELSVLMKKRGRKTLEKTLVKIDKMLVKKDFSPRKINSMTTYLRESIEEFGKGSETKGLKEDLRNLDGLKMCLNDIKSSCIDLIAFINNQINNPYEKSSENLSKLIDFVLNDRIQLISQLHAFIDEYLHGKPVV